MAYVNPFDEYTDGSPEGGVPVNAPGGSPNFNEGAAARQPAPNTGAPAFGQPSMNDQQIQAAYQSSIGRQATASELASERENANKYGAAGIQAEIAKRGAPTASAGGSGGDADQNGDGKIDAGWVLGANGQITYSGGAKAGANTFKTPNVPNQPNTSPQFTDPAQQLLESNALNRQQQLNNPDPNSGTAMYEQYAKQLVEQLKGPSYTAGNEAAIKAGAYNAIAQDEQTTQQQWLDEIARRNLRPGDGPALEGLQRIKEAFSKLRASVDQQFAVKAIDMGRTDRLQALDVLGNLQASENTRLDKALTVARIPYDMGQDSFSNNLAAVNAGGSPAQNVQTAIQLATAIQNSNSIDSAQKSYALSAIFEFLGGL